MRMHSEEAVIVSQMLGASHAHLLCHRQKLTHLNRCYVKLMEEGEAVLLKGLTAQAAERAGRPIPFRFLTYLRHWINFPHRAFS